MTVAQMMGFAFFILLFVAIAAPPPPTSVRGAYALAGVSAGDYWNLLKLLAYIGAIAFVAITIVLLIIKFIGFAWS